MKRDIIAAITFLVTGLLFYAVQSDEKPRELFASGLSCEILDPVQVGETLSDMDHQVILESGHRRDS